MTVEWMIVIFVLTVVFAATVRTTFGFGDALFNMPVLGLLLGLETATPLVAMISTTTALMLLVAEHKQIHILAARSLIIGSVAGLPVGLILLRGLYESVLLSLLGFVLVFTGLYNLRRRKIRFRLHGKGWGYGLGFVAGILGGAYNANGPPAVVYCDLQGWTPQVFRATLQGYTFPVSIFILAGHGLSGLWTTGVFRLYLVVFPIILGGFILGRILSGRLPAERFRHWLHTLLILLGFALIMKAIW